MRIAPILTIVALVTGAAGGYAYWMQEQALRVPSGLARANGRVKGEILARIDTTELVARLAGAKAAVHRAHQSIARARADVELREAELKLADVELKRGNELVLTNTITQADLDRRIAQRDVSRATLEGAKVAIEDGKAATEVAEAQVAQIEATIADMTLTAPVTGRVEYRLAQAGEVVAAGGRVLTLLDLSDVHMTIFLPTSQVGRVELGSEARIVLDSAPEYVVPATVSFVAGKRSSHPNMWRPSTSARN
jgi:HlyD family secretion protein